MPQPETEADPVEAALEEAVAAFLDARKAADGIAEQRRLEWEGGHAAVHEAYHALADGASSPEGRDEYVRRRDAGLAERYARVEEAVVDHARRRDGAAHETRRTFGLAMSALGRLHGLKAAEDVALGIRSPYEAMLVAYGDADAYRKDRIGSGGLMPGGAYGPFSEAFAKAFGEAGVFKVKARNPVEEFWSWMAQPAYGWIRVSKKDAGVLSGVAGIDVAGYFSGDDDPRMALVRVHGREGAETLMRLRRDLFCAVIGPWQLDPAWRARGDMDAVFRRSLAELSEEEAYGRSLAIAFEDVGGRLGSDRARDPDERAFEASKQLPRPSPDAVPVLGRP